MNGHQLPGIQACDHPPASTPKLGRFTVLELKNEKSSGQQWQVPRQAAIGSTQTPAPATLQISEVASINIPPEVGLKMKTEHREATCQTNGENLAGGSSGQAAADGQEVP
jgi:hypothetical protein